MEKGIEKKAFTQAKEEDLEKLRQYLKRLELANREAENRLSETEEFKKFRERKIIINKLLNTYASIFNEKITMLTLLRDDKASQEDYLRAYKAQVLISSYTLLKEVFKDFEQGNLIIRILPNFEEELK